MSLDIRRLKINPYKKLEQPNPEKFVIRYQIAALLQSALAPLAVLSAFIVPAWWYDFGASAGSAQRLVLIIVLGLLATLTVLARTLAVRNRSKLTTAERLLLVVGGLLVLGSLFGGDWRAALGLNQTTSGPYLPELILLFVWIGLIARLPQRERYMKLILTGLMLGSTILALSILVRYFIFGQSVLLTVLSAQSWPVVFSIVVILLMIFAMWQRGAPRIVWSIALFIHIVAIFLFDENLSWIILLVATSVLLMAQIAGSKKLGIKDFIYPLQVWLASLLLLAVPIKFFTGVNPTLPESHSQTVLSQAVKDNLSAASALPLGPGGAELALGRSAVSAWEVNLDTLQSAQSLPNLPVIRNGHIRFYFELGILAALAWLIFWFSFLRNGYVFVRDHLKSLSDKAIDETVYLGTVSLGAVVIILAALAFTAWSLPLAWLLATLAGLALALRAEPGQGRDSFWSDVWEKWRARLDERGIGVWLYRAGAVSVVILYVAVVAVTSRALGAERVAEAATAAEVGVRYNHWEKAVKKNPWSNFYQLKLAQSRLDVLSDAMPISDQKEIFDAVSKTLLKANAATEPVWPWLAALLYGQMEKYVEGSSQLAQQAYGRAYKLWPNNVALGTQIAKFYREKTDNLVSSEVTASQLRSDAKDYVRQALKLDPAYLPARLELALLIEKDGDLPGAVAELEPYEDDSPEIKYHVGRLYFNDNQVEAAVDKFLAVLREVPNHSNALYSLGVAYYRQGKYNEALKEFAEVDKLNPGSADVAEKLEQVREKLNKK